MTFVAMVLAARVLEPEHFGIFAIITAYVFVIDGLVSFQSWQAVIKFGATTLSDGQSDRYFAILKAGASIDVVTAVIGTLIGILVGFNLGNVFGLEGYEHLAAFSCIVLLSRLTGVPSAILRLNDRFLPIALHQVGVGFLRLCFVGFAATRQPSVSSLLVGWFAAEVVANFVLTLSGWASLGAVNRRRVWKSRLRILLPIRVQAIRFLVASNAHSTVKLTLREADMLAIGALLGPVAAGLYKIVKQIAGLAGKVVGPAYQAVYPELAKAYAGGETTLFWRLIAVPGLLVGTVFATGLIAFWFFGDWLLVAALGDSYAEAFLPACVYLLGTAISAATFGFQPGALALGIPGASLRVLTISVAFYWAVFLALTLQIGIIGAAVAYVAFYIVWSLLMIRILLLHGPKPVAFH